ncbi:hypothetical protein GOP47_0013299 [Adiantum capillus-veneris]|uniref:Uncharacterized protein n=1 Tax=Adiantum capillus-veneris TaxID=13818 RepID=A0A9D4ZD19_ADICA|nr:hypothetical protein GOP47_0013299 [Adiantum capillus-veneris]
MQRAVVLGEWRYATWQAHVEKRRSHGAGRGAMEGLVRKRAEIDLTMTPRPLKHIRIELSLSCAFRRSLDIVRDAWQRRAWKLLSPPEEQTCATPYCAKPLKT